MCVCIVVHTNSMETRHGAYGVLEKLIAREEEVIGRKSSLQHASLEPHDKRSKEIYMDLKCEIKAF